MEVKEFKKITYIQGDATAPVGDGQKIIVHVCNDIGGWGAGFVMALSKKWKTPEQVYRDKEIYTLGTYDLIRVEDDLSICNLIGQEGTISRPVGNFNMPPVRYVAIETALKKLANDLTSYDNPKHKLSVHMPMIGSGLAGGNWDIIEKIIETTLCSAGVSVTVYQFD